MQLKDRKFVTIRNDGSSGPAAHCVRKPGYRRSISAAECFVCIAAGYGPGKPEAG